MSQEHDPACSAELANPTAVQKFVLDRTSTWSDYHAGMKVLTEWLELQNFHGVPQAFEDDKVAPENLGQKIERMVRETIREEKEPGGKLHFPSLAEIEAEDPNDPKHGHYGKYENDTRRKNVLLIMAHMDDESISCGGLIQNRIRDGFEVFVMTCFDRLYNYGDGDQYVEEQREHYKKALLTLDPEHIHGLVLNPQWPEGRPTAVDPIAALKTIEEVLKDIDPVEVIIHHEDDLNQDHRFLNEISRIALRASNLGKVTRILACHGAENLTAPNWYEVMKDEQVKIKELAVGCYSREYRGSPHVRSFSVLEGKAVWLGAQVDELNAEAYTLIMEKK